MVSVVARKLKCDRSRRLNIFLCLIFQISLGATKFGMTGAWYVVPAYSVRCVDL